MLTFTNTLPLKMCKLKLFFLVLNNSRFYSFLTSRKQNNPKINFNYENIQKSPFIKIG
jgi:hypothetical protein